MNNNNQIKEWAHHKKFKELTCLMITVNNQNNSNW